MLKKNLLLLAGIVVSGSLFAAPQVSVTNPANGETISGTVNVAVNASADNGVSEVSFYVDDVYKAFDSAAPYGWSWNTAIYSNDAHTLKVVASDTAGQTASSQISVTVNNPAVDNPPSVTITAPADGASVSGSVNITVSASDDVGVAAVGFYVDGVWKSSDTSSPYGWTWNTSGYSNVSHTLSAKAVDTGGQTAANQVSVTVNNAAADNPPAVSITSPVNGTTVSGTVNVTVSATDDNGVSGVSFYVDNVHKALDSTAPYGWSWDTARYSNGAHTLKALASDTTGQTASSQISVTVSNNFIITGSTASEIGISAEIKPTETVIQPEKGQESNIKFNVGGKTAQPGEIVHVTIAIYNARGELVKTLVDQDMQVGEYQTIWNGRNFEEDVVASGVYIVRLRAGNYTASKKLVVLK